MSAQARDAFRLNAPGDFYVADGQCILCCAPEHQAPDLMGFHTDPNGSHRVSHCFFKRQPNTEDQTYRAVRAMWAACCGALRYAGSDPEIIARLVDLGLDEQIDILVAQSGRSGPRAPRVIRNHVTFDFEPWQSDSRVVLAAVGRQLVAGGSPESSFTDPRGSARTAETVFLAHSRAKGAEVICQPSSDGVQRWLVTVSVGDRHPSRIFLALSVDDALRAEGRSSDIRWYTHADWQARRAVWKPLPC